MNPNPTPPASQRGTMLSLMLTLLCGGGILFFLVLITGGFLGYPIAAVLCLIPVAYLHYRLWGQAMTQEVSGEREVQEQQERRHDPRPDDRIRRF
jgi:hypothetical protein